MFSGVHPIDLLIEATGSDHLPIPNWIENLRENWLHFQALSRVLLTSPPFLSLSPTIRKLNVEIEKQAFSLLSFDRGCKVEEYSHPGSVVKRENQKEQGEGKGREGENGDPFDEHEYCEEVCE